MYRSARDVAGTRPALKGQPMTPPRGICLHVVVLCAALLPACGGCSKTPSLMPTPNVYAQGLINPFQDVPPALQNNRVEVLYLTDRKPEKYFPDWQSYGYRRSRSLRYGVSEVEFGEDVSWAELVKASTTARRSRSLPVHLRKVRELGQFPPTPRILVEAATTTATTMPTTPHTHPATAPSPDQEQRAAEEAFRNELNSRLAASPVKDVFIFVHGYNNTLQDSVSTIAQLWHFFGRVGIPISYSWPAGRSGVLRGYTYDRESSEFTVYHLKNALTLIASCPDVRKVHIIAHSRGTDVVASALRELHLEITAGGQVTREALRLGALVLVAPDMDLDVVIQRATTVRLGRVPERFALYVCSQDRALGLSNWLFSGVLRLGQLRSDLFTPRELEAMRSLETMQIVDARVSELGSYGHGYFMASPAVSSDLVLLVRYERPPGPENGRPLRAEPNGFWVIDDSYPAQPERSASGQ